jgi:hypothetical protein
MFDPVVARRAGRKSFENFGHLWEKLPPGTQTQMQEAVSKSDHQYQWMMQKCRNEEPVEVLNNVIDIMMQSQVKKCANLAASGLSVLPPAVMGSLMAYNHICEVTFAYAPAAAIYCNNDPERGSQNIHQLSDTTDRICYDVLECIKTSNQKRRSEMNAEFVRGVLAILSSFLEMLEHDLKEEPIKSEVNPASLSQPTRPYAGFLKHLSRLFGQA